jgi:hypothetical protein
MPIERYDHYGEPRLHVVDTGTYLIRDVQTEDGEFSGICEYAVYELSGEICWYICKEGVEFSEIRPFLKTGRHQVA